MKCEGSTSVTGRGPIEGRVWGQQPTEGISRQPDWFANTAAVVLLAAGNREGFEALYVAALRSVGVPARVGAQGHAELWSGALWQAAPRPLVESWQ